MKIYIFLVLAAFLTGGCADMSSHQNKRYMAQTAQVDILKFQFIPAEITINKGDSVIWINQEKRQYHSVWFQQPGTPEPDYFFPGESFSQKFDTVGIFPYRCGPHPEMRGTITVK